MTVSTRFLTNQMTIMKKIFVFAAMAAFIGIFAASCEKAEVLEPTQIEKDWTKGIDLSNPYVKQVFEQTGVAILTEFNDTTDVFYQGSDIGVIKTVDITHLTGAEKDKAIEWFKTNIMDCFSMECIKKYFPRRIFLTKTIVVSSEPGGIGPWLHEMRYTQNLWSVNGTQHAFPFTQGFAVSVNTDVLFNEQTQIDYAKKFRNDIMSLLCFELFMKNDWLNEIQNNEDIFPEDVTMLYGARVLDTEATNSLDSPNKYVTAKGMYHIWYGYNAKHSRYGDPITKVDYRRMTLEGYFEFGFPDTGTNCNVEYGGEFRWPTGNPTTEISTYNDAGTRVEYTCDGFVNIENYHCQAPNGPYRDSRNLIGALVDLNSVKLTVYGEFLIHRLWAMSEALKDIGVDFKKFNPAVTEMYQIHDAN